MLCIVVDLITLCPMETAPKSVVVRPLFDNTTNSGCTVGQCTSRYKVLHMLKKRENVLFILLIVYLSCFFNKISFVSVSEHFTKSATSGQHFPVSTGYLYGSSPGLPHLPEAT